MKLTSISKAMLGTAIALGGTAVISQVSQACEASSACGNHQHQQSPTQPCDAQNPCAQPGQQPQQHFRSQFSCEKGDWAPTTVVTTPRGTVPVIRWVSDYFSHSGYTPQVRCDHVTGRFQRFYDEGRLDFITTGIVNRQPVVCVAGFQGGPCQDVLFTLKPQESASDAIYRLFQVRDNAGGPLYESGSRVYLDMQEYLRSLEPKS